MGQQNLRRIIYASQTLARHLKDANLECCSKSVLYTAQYAVDAIIIALKLQHDIYDMLQHLRTRDCSLLCYVTDDKNRSTRALGILEQRCRTLTNLRHATRRRVEQRRGHSLYRVNNHNIGVQCLNLRHNILEQRLGIYGTIFVIDTNTVGTQTNLLGTLLTRDIEGLHSVISKCQLQ